MILPKFTLPSFKHQMDTLEHAFNKEHFINYPSNISYQCNSRGFRDNEWPSTIEELNNCIWCFGDSFTLGVGVPFDHTWPQILEQKTGRRCINISMNGSSNTWILRKVKEVITEINPKNVVIQWTFMHRNELANTNLNDKERRIRYNITESDDDAYSRNAKIFDEIQQLNNNIIQSVIPVFKESNNADKLIANFELIHFEILDFARDYYHYDIKTATNFVNKITPMLV